MKGSIGVDQSGEDSGKAVQGLCPVRLGVFPFPAAQGVYPT
ncbi:MAG: hypothetical protein ACPGYX_11840 [Oceanobacter sp.]